MKIAVFIKKTTFQAGYGGLETQNKVLCEYLVKNGHEVTVFAPMWDFEDTKREESGVTYIFVKSVYRLLFAFSKTSWENQSYNAFMSLHAQNNFDLVVSQSSAAIGVIKRKNSINIPIVSIVHGSIVGEMQSFYQSFVISKKSFGTLWLFIKNTGFSLYNFFTRQRLFIHGSNKVICVSNFVKRSLIEETFDVADKFVVIYNSLVETSHQKHASKEIETPFEKKVIYIGQISKQKGSDILYRLACDQKFSNVQFHLIGSGDLYEELFEKAQENNLVEKFVLHGQLSYNLTQQFLYEGHFDAFVFPTRRKEGLPMVLIEALSAGIPIVAFDCGGVEDTIEDGKTGYLVNAGKIDMLEDKLLEILNNSKLRGDMSEASILLARQKFDIAKMVQNYENVFFEVINEHTKNNL